MPQAGLVARLASFAAATAFVISRPSDPSCAWCRRFAPLRGSTENADDENTYCHFHSVAADGNGIASVSGV